MADEPLMLAHLELMVGPASRWTVYLGTQEQPGRVYWSCPDEVKAQQIVQDLARIGCPAFYVPPKETT